MEELAYKVTFFLGRCVELSAAVLIGFASLKAIIQYVAGIFDRSIAIFPRNEIRLSLGRTLVLALEFLLAADILKTAVAPSWDDIGKLAAIAILRTGLNYFLERELRNADYPKAKPPRPDLLA